MTSFFTQWWDERSDYLGDEVRLRLHGVLLDLHAADARQLI